MTLEEAIIHCEEVVEEQEKLMKRYDDASGYNRYHIEEHRLKEAIKCQECANDIRQLAEWLRELQIYRQKLTEIEAAVDCYKNCETCQGFREYPTDEFVKDLTKVLMEVNADGSN